MMFVTVFLNSCSDTVQPNINELVLENIKANDFVLDEAFARTAQILQQQGDLELLVSTANSRDAFITKMNDLVADVVPDVIEMHGIQFATSVMEWDASASHHLSVQNNLKQLGVGIFGPNPGSGALELYSAEIDNKLDLLEGELILVENHRTANGDRPIENYSFNFGQIKNGKPSINITIVPLRSIQSAKVGLGHLILANTNEDIDEAVKEFVADNPETEILIGLLVPAIQKVRDVPSGAKTPYQEFTDIVFGNQITPERKAWDQQVRYAAFLAALDFIISEDFHNDNEDHASIPLQDAMHHAACVLMWSKIYDLYKS